MKIKIFLLVVLISIGLTQCVSILNTAENEVKENTTLSKEDKIRVGITDYAKEQLGASYRYAGRDPRGFDCSGFTHYVLDNFDIKVSTSSRTQANEGKKIDVNEVNPGDLIFFKRSKAGKVFHVAMVVSNTGEGIQVIHSTSRGVVIDNISQSKYWKPKISSARDVVEAGL
jgi:cell wall-associated NlpC family hydrolase